MVNMKECHKEDTTCQKHSFDVPFQNRFLVDGNFKSYFSLEV